MLVTIISFYSRLTVIRVVEFVRSTLDEVARLESERNDAREKRTGGQEEDAMDGTVAKSARLMIFQDDARVVYQTIPNCLVKKFRPKMAADL